MEFIQFSELLRTVGVPAAFASAIMFFFLARDKVKEKRDWARELKMWEEIGAARKEAHAIATETISANTEAMSGVRNYMDTLGSIVSNGQHQQMEFRDTVKACHARTRFLEEVTPSVLKAVIEKKEKQG